MLISESLMFIHNPRTGGSSVREYLRQALPDDYHPAADPDLDEKKKQWLIHQGLGVAWEYAQRLGLEPASIPALVCIRNPYSLTLSGYKKLAQRWSDQIEDMEDTFYDYLLGLEKKAPPGKLEKMANFPYGPFNGFMTVKDKVPNNLTVARTESLVEDVQKFLELLTDVRPAFEFPYRNRSEHVHFSAYYTQKEEEIVYRMYKNTFESGLYKRYEGLDQQRLS